jgi:hypothetical protein
MGGCAQRISETDVISDDVGVEWNVMPDEGIRKL